MTRLRVRLALALAVVPALAAAQAPAPAAGPFDNLRFRGIGPATMSGRIDDFAVLERNPAVFYVGTATGGVWKTTNMGTTFEPVFDKEGSSSIGDVAIAPTDANLVWVGTGENNNRQSSSWGDGVYKSADGGKTWKNMGLRDSKQIARILVDPMDHDVVYVAALGDLWKAGGERGVYKTTDGGLTWSQVLQNGPETGAIDLVMDPANNKVLYAALYQRRRSTWGFNGGGPGSGIWKSTDAGRSWSPLTKGIPVGPLGRIGLDVFRQNPNILYARIEHEKESGVYRSDDAGASWTKTSAVNPRPMYFSQIRIDPANENRLYMLGTSLHVSEDGGKTWKDDGARNIHVDHHAMWIDPNNPDHLIIGNDGGVSISHDRARTWVWMNNLPVGQFYHASYDMGNPYTICGGLQDNDTWCGPSAVRSKAGIANDNWFVVQGGDGFVGLIDPSDPNVIYAESQDGFMSRIDRRTNERQVIRPEPALTEKSFRWNWDTPIQLSPHDPKTLYVGAHKVYRSTDRGYHWAAISPDLTLGWDRDTLELMGIKGKDVRIAQNDGVDAWPTLFTLAESRMKAGMIWTGSDDGQVHVTRDAGATWTNVTGKIPGAPRLAYVSKVEPSKFAEGTAYVTFDGHRTGDFGTYAYATTDYGASWKSIAGNLPAGQIVRTITEDLKNADVLYLGTETGLWVTLDRGKTWHRVRANLPTVPVYEITLHPRENDMILATHGRAIWVLDDLAPFQQAAQAMAANAFVFTAEAGTQWSLADDRMREFEGDRIFLGPNPERGIGFSYYLKTKADSATITIKDAAGATTRVFKGDTFKDRLGAGINTVRWDMRVEPLPAPKGGSGPSFFGSGVDGPDVLPGRYTATLAVNGADVGTTPAVVIGDPEIPISDADRKARFDLLTDLHALQAQVNTAADKVTEIHDGFGKIKEALKDTAATPAPIRAAMDSVSKAMEPFQASLGIGGEPAGFSMEMFRKNIRMNLMMLKMSIMGATMLPTQAQLDQADDLRKAIPTLRDQVNAVVPKYAALVRQLSEAGLYPKVPEPVK
ncbi:MAG: hypothetical protein H6R40_28 [Gemmatimonadetes bacterium]|nr:hypothetical protein [Gemmatimonadota bacterium]